MWAYISFKFKKILLKNYIKNNINYILKFYKLII
jgi:hypothetical protein